MRTLEDVLIEKRIEPEASYECTSCGHSFPSFAVSVKPELVRKRHDREHDILGVLCTNCRLDAERHKIAVAEAEATAQRGPWETDFAEHVRVVRNRRVEAALWAVDPVTSPLTEDCQAAFAAYIKALHRISIEFAEPEAVVWPEQPPLQYKEIS